MLSEVPVCEGGRAASEATSPLTCEAKLPVRSTVDTVNWWTREVEPLSAWGTRAACLSLTAQVSQFATDKGSRAGPSRADQGEDVRCPTKFSH